MVLTLLTVPPIRTASPPAGGRPFHAAPAGRSPGHPPGPRTAGCAGLAGAIEGPALDQALQYPLVDLAQIDPLAEIEQRAERAVCALGDDGVDGAFAHVFDRHQPEEDLLASNGEGFVAFVDVGRLHRDVVAAAFGDELDTPSEECISLVSRAAMNSTGKWALR
jgi:hypothetical protein